MKLTSFLSSSSLLLLTAQLSTARRHHHALAARQDTEATTNDNITDTNPISVQSNTNNDFHIYKPGDKWGYNPPAIATSYIPDRGVPLSGSCGWEGMKQQTNTGQQIYGAAQMYSVFGNGVSCGTCLRLNPTERKLYGDVGSFTVSVINSCPGECKSLDLESNGIVAWLKRPRVGQLGIVGEVVPCNFKAAGIFVEVFQFTTSQYDARFNFRGNSGAIQQAEIACAGTNAYFPMKKENPGQYTLIDNSKSSTILGKCQSLNFRLTNFRGEKVVLPSVPNKLFQRGAAQEWFMTNTNFETT